jgi:hypothetical protein
MGQTQTKSVAFSEVINDVMTSIVISNEQKCITDNKNVQNLSIKNIKVSGCKLIIGANQEIELNSEISCIQKLKTASDMTSEFESKLDAKIKAKTEGGVGLTTSESATIARSITKIKNSIDISSISTCITESLNQQNAEIGSIMVKCYEWQDPEERVVNMGNIKQKIIQNQVVKCMQSNDSVQKASAEIDSVLESSSQLMTKGGALALLGGGGGTSSSSSSSSCILLLIIAVIMSMPSDKKKK